MPSPKEYFQSHYQKKKSLSKAPYSERIERIQKAIELREQKGQKE